VSSDGLRQSLIEEMSEMEIVDTHEHLPNEAERLAQDVDFATLFSHYCRSDLVAAGMPDRQYDRLVAPDLSPSEKWELLAPYYELIFAGGYSRAAHLAMQRFYGMSRLDSADDAEELSRRIQEANKPGLYRRVLKEACRITTALNFVDFAGKEVDPEFFTPILFVTPFAEVASLEALCAIETETGTSGTTLSRYVDGLARYLSEQQKNGLKGIKFLFAYSRDLRFDPVDAATAERIFSRIVSESCGIRTFALGYEETRPLQDHLVHRLIEVAGDLDLTVVFHTGIQAGNYNDLDNARPTQLWDLFRRFSRVRFNLLHSGLPFVDEAGLLAKYFPNVTIDMAWMHAISPEISIRALRDWVDLVPRNKVLGFGGDYQVVEKAYGHLVLARENIATALADKVQQGAMGREEARAWVRALLWENPRAVCALD
jgi:predicted TIM-barrel fold metal-dependent hydrolase